MVGMPSNYASNAVACKLWGILESPVELILGGAIFNALKQMYGWPCWVFTDWEFRTFADREQNTGQETFAIVPQFGVSGVGHVDFAIFASQISVEKPLVVIEADGHSYHERTPAQASEDRVGAGMTA
jgi:hypothetical protein